MDRVLQGFRWSRCLVYLDDIISFGSTFGDVLDNLTLIFERLRSYGLQLKSTNCHLFPTSVPFLGHIVGRRGLECDPVKIEDVKLWPIPDCLKSVRQFLGFVGYYRHFIPNFADIATPLVALTGKDVPFVWEPVCSTAFYTLRESFIHAPILAFPTETGQYILDTDASNFGLGGVLSQIQDDVERVVAYHAYCSRAPFGPLRDVTAQLNARCWLLWPCASSFRLYLRGAKFTLRTDHKSLVWLHRFKDTEGGCMLYNSFSSPSYTGRAGTMVMRTVSQPDCPPVVEVTESVDQPFDSESTGSSEDTDLIPIHSDEDWVALLDDPVCITLHSWISSGEFPSWIEVKGLSPELRLLWHHRNNLSVHDNGIIWRKRSTQSPLLQLLVPKPGREQLFLSYHASLFQKEVSSWMTSPFREYSDRSSLGSHCDGHLVRV